MSLVEEYRRQRQWRDWERVLALCPIVPGQEVLDLGCGTGDVSAALADRGARVTGVDGNEDMLATARERCPKGRFEQHDLKTLQLRPGRFDGLWCSFTAAYFVDFAPMLARWITFLKPKAWVCLVDIDDLLGHAPLSGNTRGRIESFYVDAASDGRYDFLAGRKLASTLRLLGFEVQAFDLLDQELSFAGPALPEVIEAWSARLARMGGLKAFLGERFVPFTDEFIDCLSSPQHLSTCKVVCCIGNRNVE